MGFLFLFCALKDKEIHNLNKDGLFNLPLKKNIDDMWGLLPIFLSTLGLGIAFGGYIPLVALWLEHQDLSFSKIGIITGAASIGVITSAYFGSLIVRKIGYLNGCTLGLFVGAITTIGFRYFDSEVIWFSLRVIAGLGFGLHWVVSEAWLGNLVTENNRTKAMALYTSAMALGFAMGPLIIWITGYVSKTPFFIIGLVQVICIIPLFFLKQHQPNKAVKKIASPFFLIKAAPTIAAGCILVGIVDLSLISLLPALVARVPNVTIELAFLFPIVMGLGNVFFQYPIALFSDWAGKRQTANIVTFFGILCCSFIPFFFNQLFLALSLAFVGCGLIYCIYTLSLSLLSERYKGDRLIAANASFIIIFEISSLTGPVLAGKMIDWSIQFGLSIFLISIGVIYLFVSGIRTFQKNFNNN